MTTGGGLYRYRLRDIIEVVGFENQCPLLRFIGRADRVSDLVGEKLNETHVAQTLHKVCAAHGVRPRFAMIVPVESPAGYQLYLEANRGQISTDAVNAILRQVEAGLYENPYYRYAVQLQQLQPLKLRLVDEPLPRLWQIYERVMLDRGVKVGEVKPAALDSWTGWQNAFDGVNKQKTSRLQQLSSKS